MSEVKVENLISLNKRAKMSTFATSRTGRAASVTSPEYSTKFIFKKGILAYSGPTLASHNVLHFGQTHQTFHHLHYRDPNLLSGDVV